MTNVLPKTPVLKSNPSTKFNLKTTTVIKIITKRNYLVGMQTSKYSTKKVKLIIKPQGLINGYFYYNI